jgi:hypothetical protein
MASLEERFWTKVDKTGDCWLWTGAKLPNGYGTHGGGSNKRYAHRLAYEFAVGPIAEGMDIDHRCHVRDCVKPDHLRQATRKQNIENHNGDNPYRGARRHSKGRWEADVTHNGKTIYLGLFDTREQAAEAARVRRLELHTHNDMDRTA